MQMFDAFPLPFRDQVHKGTILPRRQSGQLGIHEQKRVPSNGPEHGQLQPRVLTIHFVYNRVLSYGQAHRAFIARLFVLFGSRRKPSGLSK